MCQVNTASNVLSQIFFLCVCPYCSHYVTINDGISSPNDDSESHTGGDCPLSITKTINSLYDDYMNISKTVSQSYCRAKSLLTKMLHASTHLSLFYLFYRRVLLFFKQSPYRRSSGYFDLRSLDGTKIHASAKCQQLKIIQRDSTLLVERRAAFPPTA
jgi:hypothetical protein